MPGTVIALGVILMWSGKFGVNLYNTAWIIFVAYIARYMAFSLKSTSAALEQVHDSLEEAARACGATHWQALRDIVLPLIKPGMVAAFFLIFLPALRELTTSVLLYGPTTRTIGVAIYALNEDGETVYAATLASVALVIIIVGQLVIKRDHPHHQDRGRCSSMSHVKLEDVTKRSGAVVAVDNLNLEIEQGRVLLASGPLGLREDDDAAHDGRFRGPRRRARSLVGGKRLLVQLQEILPPAGEARLRHGLPGLRRLAAPQRLRQRGLPAADQGLPEAEIAREAPDQGDHTTRVSTGCRDSYPNELSGGQKQRIALARAIAINPTVMLLDEPLSNLDPKLREEMRFEIKDLQRRFGFTILYVTHDQAEAMALSDRILVMD